MLFGAVHRLVQSFFSTPFVGGTSLDCWSATLHVFAVTGSYNSAALMTVGVGLVLGRVLC